MKKRRRWEKIMKRRYERCNPELVEGHGQGLYAQVFDGLRLTTHFKKSFLRLQLHDLLRQRFPFQLQRA